MRAKPARSGGADAGDVADFEQHDGVDLRGVPANACPACGSRVLYVKAIFDDYDLAAWFMDASCAECGALLTAPCPPDRPADYFPFDTGDADDLDERDS